MTSFATSPRPRALRWSARDCALAAIFALASHPASAHHPGGAGNMGSGGAITTIGGDTLARGEGTAAFIFEYTRLNAISDASLAYYAGRHEHVHSLSSIYSPALGLAYGVTDDLTVSARLPYVGRTDIREGHHAHGGGGVINSAVARGDARGIGDVSSQAQYRILNDRHSGTQWSVLAGVKAPTGEKRVYDKDGELFEPEFTPGSGSWDWSAGLAVSHRLAARWGLHANVLQTWVGRSAWDGIEPTRLGNRFQYNLAATYRLAGPLASVESRDHGHAHSHAHAPAKAPAAPAVDLILELNGEVHDPQQVAGETDKHSGGHTAYLSPGVRVTVDRWSAFVSAGVPVIADLNGAQAELTVRVVAGVAVAF